MTHEDGLTVRLASAEETLASQDTRLVDLVDGLLEHGVVLSGEVWLTVADIDLVFLGVNAVLTHPERVIGGRAP